MGDQRHGTLRAAIEWSYDLLPEDEQRLFRALAVFPDGFDLSAAETVARDVAPAVDRPPPSPTWSTPRCS